MSQEGTDIALDGGVLVALAVGEDLATAIKDKIMKDELRAVSHELALTEMMYILCRSLGWEIAAAKKDYLLDSGLIAIDRTAELMNDAAKIKCERALALPDCFTLATAKRHKCKAVFVRMEDELRKEISRKPLDIEVSYLRNKDKIAL
jgi:predicted nucleic acid-binding protein